MKSTEAIEAVTESNDESDDNTRTIKTPSPNKLHCHESCANYTVSCETPMECKQKRLNKEGCPITKQVGYHSCGMIRLVAKKEYLIEQGRRMLDKQLQTIGPIEEEVRIVEI